MKTIISITTLCLIISSCGGGSHTKEQAVNIIKAGCDLKTFTTALEMLSSITVTVR